jgi:hypothetical protein
MNEILVALFLVELRELVLEDFVEVAAFATTWNRQAHLRHVAYDEVEKSGEEQIGCLLLIFTVFLNNEVHLGTILGKILGKGRHREKQRKYWIVCCNL